MTAFRLRRAPSVSARARTAATLVAALAAVLVAGLLLGLLGLAPVALGGAVLRQGLATRFGIEDLVVLAAPLVMCGLSVALTLRVGLWNIGADGQFFVGAACAAGIGLYGPDWPALAMLGLMAGAAMLGGAAWIALPALARLTLGTSEIISTLLLNFVARLGIDWLVTGPWRDRFSSVTAQSPRVPYPLPRLPHAWHLGAMHWGLAVVLALAALLSLVLSRTVWGYELRVCGANRDAAAYTGMAVRRRLGEAMLLGGAIAGLGGMLELAGTVHRLQAGLSNNYGYVGIIVAVLAAGSPLGTLLTGLLLALVLEAGSMLQTQGVPSSAAVALTGLMLLFVAVGEQLAHYRLVRTRPA